MTKSRTSFFVRPFVIYYVLFHLLPQLIRQPSKLGFLVKQLLGISQYLRHRAIIRQPSFHCKSFFFQLIKADIVFFKSFGRTLELAFLVVGIVVKSGVNVLHIAFGVLYAIFLCPFTFVNITALLTAKIGIVGLVLDNELSADSTICNYAVSLFQHININTENGKERIIGNISCLPSAVKVRVIDMYCQIGGRSIYLLRYVPITNIAFGSLTFELEMKNKLLRDYQKIMDEMEKCIIEKNVVIAEKDNRISELTDKATAFENFAERLNMLFGVFEDNANIGIVQKVATSLFGKK